MGELDRCCYSGPRFAALNLDRAVGASGRLLQTFTF